jgi:hypothetical protein
MKQYKNKNYAKNRETILYNSKLKHRPEGGLKCVLCGDIIPLEMSAMTKFCDKCIKSKKTSRQTRWYRKHKKQISKIRKKSKKGVVK